MGILKEIERDLYMNRMCDYLFETSQKFNKFYESCSVNKAESPEIKASRLTICTATAGTIRLRLTIDKCSLKLPCHLLLVSVLDYIGISFPEALRERLSYQPPLSIYHFEATKLESRYPLQLGYYFLHKL